MPVRGERDDLAIRLARCRAGAAKPPESRSGESEASVSLGLRSTVEEGSTFFSF